MNQTEMKNFRSYRTWIPADSNSAEGGITVYTVACNLSDGVQANVFSFEQDAYLFLVDQAEGLTDAQRSELKSSPRAKIEPSFGTSLTNLFRRSPVTGSSHIPSHFNETFF